VSWGIHEDDPQADAAIGRRVAAQFQTDHHREDGSRKYSNEHQ
jgi:hypothetical protein